MIKKLIKLYIDAIKNAPENIEKAIETQKKKKEIIDDMYKNKK